MVDGSVGGLYLDPEAADGCRFKMFAHRMGRAVIDDARRDAKHPQHAEAMRPEPFEHLADELTLVSRDGLKWEVRRDYDCAQPHWHPEPPLFGFWNEREKRHGMTVRPGYAPLPHLEAKGAKATPLRDARRRQRPAAEA